MITINRNQASTKDIGCYIENIMVHFFILGVTFLPVCHNQVLCVQVCIAVRLPNNYLSKVRFNDNWSSGNTFPIFESKHKYFFQNIALLHIYVNAWFVFVFIDMMFLWDRKNWFSYPQSWGLFTNIFPSWFKFYVNYILLSSKVT